MAKSSGGFLSSLTRSVSLKLATQVITSGVTLGVGLLALLIFGTKSPGQIATIKVTVPVWALALALVITVAVGTLFFVLLRRRNAKEGREIAAEANVKLMERRSKLPERGRIIRSTRFTDWPPNESSRARTSFRQELDEAILREETIVRRLWNVTSDSDVARLEEIGKRYAGRPNHSIRVFFDVPHQLLPELLIVGSRSSLSLPSPHRPTQLDFALVLDGRLEVKAVADYFDAMWEGAVRFFEAGEILPEGRKALESFKKRLASKRL